MSKRYAVLDANGVVVNHILIKDPLPAKYWPGYGKTLLPLEPCDVSAGAALDVVKLKIGTIPQIGDTVNLTTGAVTKFQPKMVEDEITKELCASAPVQAFTKDADPTTTKTVTDNPTIETKEPTKVTVKGGK